MVIYRKEFPYDVAILLRDGDEICCCVFEGSVDFVLESKAARARSTSNCFMGGMPRVFVRLPDGQLEEQVIEVVAEIDISTPHAAHRVLH